MPPQPQPQPTHFYIYQPHQQIQQLQAGGQQPQGSDLQPHTVVPQRPIELVDDIEQPTIQQPQPMDVQNQLALPQAVEVIEEQHL